MISRFRSPLEGTLGVKERLCWEGLEDLRVCILLSANLGVNERCFGGEDLVCAMFWILRLSVPFFGVKEWK